jgi:hypothetical protein
LFDCSAPRSLPSSPSPRGGRSVTSRTTGANGYEQGIVVQHAPLVVGEPQRRHGGRGPSQHCPPHRARAPHRHPAPSTSPINYRDDGTDPTRRPACTSQPGTRSSTTPLAPTNSSSSEPATPHEGPLTFGSPTTDSKEDTCRRNRWEVQDHRERAHRSPRA